MIILLSIQTSTKNSSRNKGIAVARLTPNGLFVSSAPLLSSVPLLSSSGHYLGVRRTEHRGSVSGTGRVELGALTCASACPVSIVGVPTHLRYILPGRLRINRVQWLTLHRKVLRLGLQSRPHRQKINSTLSTMLPRIS